MTASQLALTARPSPSSGGHDPAVDGHVIHRPTRSQPIHMTSFELRGGQRATLNELSERLGVSKAEVLRRALDEFAEREAATREEVRAA